MPTYEYERADGSRFEIVQKITEDALTTCPTTGQKVTRLVSAPAFHLKGSGWYKTDYGSSGSGASGSGSTTTPDDKSKTESKKSESKTESKTETKKESSSSAGGDASD